MLKTRHFFARLTLALAVMFCAAAPSLADTLIYSGVVSPEGPYFRRPIETGEAFSPLIDDFGFPTQVAYHSFNFSVDTGGLYTFASIQEGFNGFLVLYEFPFDAANGLANFVAANDDFDPFGGAGFSLFSVEILANVRYELLTTGFDETQFGGFLNLIDGPGQIRAIPEPTTMLLLGTGLLGGIGAIRRRKQQS